MTLLKRGTVRVQALLGGLFRASFAVPLRCPDFPIDLFSSAVSMSNGSAATGTSHWVARKRQE